MLSENLQVASPDEIALRVADEITDLIRARREQGRTAVLALPAGSTPKLLYAELARRHREEELSFDNVVVFGLDEYLGVSSAHPQNFRRLFERELFGPVELPRENAHLLASDLHPTQVESHCQDYERSIQKVGGLDYALLGLGLNGHLAFNEPGSSADSRTRAVLLDAATRDHAAAAFGRLEFVPLRGITMGLGTIRAARAVRLMITGASKRDPLGRALASSAPTPELPATLLADHPDLALWADPEATRALEPERVTSPHS